MKRVLITGCRGGIGLNVARRLLEKGHMVYVTVHFKESISKVKKELGDSFDNLVVEKLDILNDKDCRKVDSWDIDVLINNAAIGDSGPLLEIPVERVRDVFETNIFAALKLTQRVAKKMVKSESGRIIFISSIAGLIPTPYLSPYAMTKFAIENMVFSLRDELKPFNIDVVAVNPGAYNTGFNQKNIAKKYEWLSSKTFYKGSMDEIKKNEDRLIKMEVQSTNSIARQVVRAVEAKRPKRRYVAPKWQWFGVPILRRFF